VPNEVDPLVTEEVEQVAKRACHRPEAVVAGFLRGFAVAGKIDSDDRSALPGEQVKDRLPCISIGSDPMDEEYGRARTEMLAVGKCPAVQVRKLALDRL
jgi:hypothetical protein